MLASQGGPKAVPKLGPFPSKLGREELWELIDLWEFSAVRFAAEDKAQPRGRQFVEFWEGITPRQGRWKTLEDGTILAIPPAPVPSTRSFFPDS